jgi:metal-dependent HD superfamily phosphatase/phosphodiesterase
LIEIYAVNIVLRGVGIFTNDIKSAYSESAMSHDAIDLQALLGKLRDIGDEIARNRHHLEHLSLEFSRVDSVVRAAGLRAGEGRRLFQLSAAVAAPLEGRVL